MIYGIPWRENENIEENIRKLASALKVPFNKAVIAGSHRLSSKTGSIPPISIRFLSYDMKKTWIKASKREKLSSDVLNLHSPTPIYCDKHVTERNKRLLLAAKRLKQNGNVKYV